MVKRRQIVELFGKKLIIAEGDCPFCALKSFCEKVNEMAEDYPDWNHPTICQDTNGSIDRIFVEFKED